MYSNFQAPKHTSVQDISEVYNYLSWFADFSIDWTLDDPTDIDGTYTIYIHNDSFFNDGLVLTDKLLNAYPHNKLVQVMSNSLFGTNPPPDLNNSRINFTILGCADVEELLQIFHVNKIQYTLYGSAAETIFYLDTTFRDKFTELVNIRSDIFEDVVINYPKDLVIYHHNCADGFSAAWCFHHYDGKRFEFFPGIYNKPLPDVEGRNVWVVDFSYPREQMLELISKANKVTWIDHHASAIAESSDLEYPNFFKHLNNNHSGAMLAWMYLFPNKSPPLLLNHVEDRDLWRFKLPLTREIQSNVFSYEYTFTNWDTLMGMGQNDLVHFASDGKALERKHIKDIKELLVLCKRKMIIAGHEVWVANLPYTMASDACEQMYDEVVPFTACYYDTPDERIFSLRSPVDGIDVGKIAKQYNGGGHEHASGFKVPRDHELART